MSIDDGFRIMLAGLRQADEGRDEVMRGLEAAWAGRKDLGGTIVALEDTISELRESIAELQRLVLEQGQRIQDQSQQLQQLRERLNGGAR